MTRPLDSIHLTLWITAALALSLAFTGCAKDPSAAAPKAEVGEKKVASPAGGEESAAKAAAPAPSGADKATATTAKSASAPAKSPAKSAPKVMALEGTLGFVGSKVTGSHTGLFKTWSGEARLGAVFAGAKVRRRVDDRAADERDPHETRDHGDEA